MQFLLLIYEAESLNASRSEADHRAIFQGYAEFTESLRASGKLLGGEALKPVESATTVRVRGGKPVVTDGPFAETKEQLGGFYVIEAVDLDDALAIAGRLPTATSGSIEVRPILRYG